MRTHFIGIGGAGMSAIAELMLGKGAQVSGSDIADSPKIQSLRDAGAQIFLGHEAANVDAKTDVVVYTSAVRRSKNPELLEAERLGIRTVRRAEYLAESIAGEKVIAVAGTHGKTTTTAMIAAVLIEAALDPTVVAGGSLPMLGGKNSRVGNGGYAIVEADEFDRSFLSLRPWIAVITSLEAEHLDIYSGLADLEQTFAQFANAPSGIAGEVSILCIDDDNVRALATKLDKKIVTYGLHSPEAKYSAKNQVNFGGRVQSDIYRGGELLGKLDVGVPGDHNQQNALAAIAVGDTLGIPFSVMSAGLNKFAGVDRRFTVHTASDGLVVVDDYAHHPTEIRAAIAAAKQQYPGVRITACFQPHTFTRTRDFFAEFAAALSEATEVFLLDIYPAREQPIKGVTSDQIAEHITKVPATRVTLAELPDRLLDQIRNGKIGQSDVILFLGAGTVPEASAKLLGLLQKRTAAPEAKSFTAADIEPQVAGSNQNDAVTS